MYIYIYIDSNPNGSCSDLIDFPSQDPGFWLSVVKELPHGWRLAYEQGPVSLRDNVEATLFPLRCFYNGFLGGE